MFYRAGIHRADANLHNPILDDGDDDAACEISRAVMKRAGHSDTAIEQILGKPSKQKSGFNPDEPRDPHGRWTDEGETGLGATFVSPNVEHLGFEAAKNHLLGERQDALRMASAEIDAQLHHHASDDNIIGAWADGAENSVMTTVSNANWDGLRVAAAMKGYLADQKQTLIFKQIKDGPSALYKFEAPGSIDQIHKDLLDDGVAFHTLVPGAGGKGATVYVADIDGSAHDAVAKAAERYDTTVEYQRGKAEFLGTTQESGTDREQRDDARRIYQEIIKQSPVQGSQGVWRRVHNRWGETLNPDNDSFVHKDNGEHSDKLLANEDLTDFTDHPEDINAAFLTPEGQVRDTGGYSHADAARQSGTKLDDLLEEGAARIYVEEGLAHPEQGVFGVHLYHRPSEQQWSFMRRTAAKVKPTRFVVDGPEGYAGTITAEQGFIKPRDMLGAINKTFPVRIKHAH